MDAETKQRTIRLDGDIDQWLTGYAQRTRRSVNAAINVILGEAREREENDRIRGTPQPANPTP